MKAVFKQSDEEMSIRYPGWGVLVAAFAGVMVSFAPIIPYTFSLFLDPLHAEFGWKREAMGGAFALAAITVALVSPLIGLLLDRFPPRRIILPGILVFRTCTGSIEPVDAKHRSVLRHVFCHGPGCKCDRTVRVHAHHTYLVHDSPWRIARIAADRKRRRIYIHSAADGMDDRASRMAKWFSHAGGHSPSWTPIGCNTRAQSARGSSCPSRTSRRHWHDGSSRIEEGGVLDTGLYHHSFRVQRKRIW